MAKSTQSNSKKKNTAKSAVNHRSREQLMAAFVQGLEGKPARLSDLERAQDLMWDAWDTSNHKKRIEMANKALAISPLCADAFVMLAYEHATRGAERIDLFRKGVAAGEKALGKRAFKEDAGHFWGILETRPYMRARHGLAGELWRAGARDESISHYRSLLELNPNDNQGIRYEFLDHLLEAGRDTEAQKLLAAYEGDHSAWWLFGKALLCFRQGGDSNEARNAANAAIKYNPFVPVM